MREQEGNQFLGEQIKKEQAIYFEVVVALCVLKQECLSGKTKDKEIYERVGKILSPSIKRITELLKNHEGEIPITDKKNLQEIVEKFIYFKSKMDEAWAKKQNKGENKINPTDNFIEALEEMTTQYDSQGKTAEENQTGRNINIQA